jgi:hypothetical protein
MRGRINKMRLRINKIRSHVNEHIKHTCITFAQIYLCVGMLFIFISPFFVNSYYHKRIEVAFVNDVSLTHGNVLKINYLVHDIECTCIYKVNYNYRYYITIFNYGHTCNYCVSDNLNYQLCNTWKLKYTDYAICAIIFGLLFAHVLLLMVFVGIYFFIFEHS